jgi:hypothetical protein
MSDLKSEGQNIEIPDLELALYDSRKTKAVITYSGPLRVTACKRIKRSERPQPQPNFELTLEKRPLPILGATLRPESGQQRLRLTPSAHDCRSNVNRGVDWYLDVVVPEGKNKAKLISLQGDRFAEQPARSKGLDKVSINVKPGKALARISLSGSLDLAGYPLTMKGTVVARRCQVAPKKKP